ncbi:MAG: A/G-specific adenine glycosylase [Porphyromonadaceae bacterium]|nr:A/G-specific adenine glycosylase [Porphyromonadaceae bacterium]
MGTILSATDLAELRSSLALWFGQNARALPWRETTDPYRIWLSEVILQQTQVVQGLGYYNRFIDAYPTIQDLARASEDDVLRLWQGLGYYSRGRNLLRAARMVVDEFEGIIPRDLHQIKRLPGVGPYTQAAVLSFAYNLPYAAVDGNVYRVISRLLGIDDPIDTPSGQKLFRALAQDLLDPDEPGRHNQAMIELGALCCTPRKPNCPTCPFAWLCVAHRQGNQLNLPIKQGKIKITERYLHYFLVRINSGDAVNTLIRRRGKGDIWEGLYELPLVETALPQDLEGILGSEDWGKLSQGLEQMFVHPQPVATLKHRLTHRLLYANLYLVEAKSYTPDSTASGYLLIDEEDRGQYGMPILLDKMLSSL